MSSPGPSPIIQLSPEAMDARRKRQRRNAIALGLVLGFLVLLFYVLTIVKMGAAVFTQTDV
jgi:hypothetical protein